MARGWNLHEFGQQIAYHPTAISRIENGKRPPTESFADQCDRVFPERRCWFHEFWEESKGWIMTILRQAANLWSGVRRPTARRAATA